MPRKAARTDRNQKEIVAYARALGATVSHTHMIGKGFPDIVVGYRGINYLVEIKDGEAPERDQRLTKDEIVWNDAWRGSVNIVRSTKDIKNMLFANKSLKKQQK